MLFRSVAAAAASTLPEAERPTRLVLVGPSTQKQQVPAVPADTLVIHGDQAITKYVCSRHMGLNRVLDYLLFTQARSIDWVAVAQRLDEAGLKTAGWCTLRWIQLLVPDAAISPVSFTATIKPGKLRAAYLNYWIDHDLPGLLLDRASWLIQAAFTLPMHDKLSDARRAFLARANPDSNRFSVDASVE